jgi:DNA-binding HxlR family transcriptional regulator
MDILAEKYASSVLKFLSEHGRVKKKDLRHIVKTVSTLDKLLNVLAEQGYVELKSRIEGRRTYSITLTHKGFTFANKIKAAEDVASGKSIPKESVTIEIPQGLHEQILRILKLDRVERSEEEFILNAVRDKIERRKREHPGHP